MKIKITAKVFEGRYTLFLSDNKINCNWNLFLNKCNREFNCLFKRKRSFLFLEIWH